MNSNLSDIKIIPITDLRRNFGEITADLARIDRLILTKDGRPFAELRATKEEKMAILKKAAGSLKGSDVDNDKFWAEVLKRKSRLKKLSL